MQWIFWMPSQATPSDLWMFVGILWLIHQVVALGSSVIFNRMHQRDVLSRLRFDKGKEPPTDLLGVAWREWLLNHVLVVPIFMGLILYPLFLWRGGNLDSSMPSLVEFLVDLAVCIFANETIFYFSHRLLHSKKLFRLIHRKHHTFRHVRPVSSEYAHPLENLLNLIAMYAGLVIMGSSFFTWGVWVALRIYETNDGHSGYAHINAASRHAYHHLYPTKGCYGTALGLWDRLLGTDGQWREWDAKQKARLEESV